MARPNRSPLPLGAALVACGLALSTLGCFNAAALADANAKSADGEKLDHFDLGAFRITLPHLSGQGGAAVVEFHAFGRVQRRHRSEAAHALESHGPAIRSQIITAIRTLDRTVLMEPGLETVRDRIAAVVAYALEKKLPITIGFEQFEFYPL